MKLYFQTITIINLEMWHGKKFVCWAALTLLALLIGGCSWFQYMQNYALSPIIPDTTKVLSEETVNKMSADPSYSTLIFPMADPVLQSLRVGDVIVCGITPATPYGLLRKVTEIQSTDQGVVLKTVQAALTDAIFQGETTLETPLFPEDLSEYCLNSSLFPAFEFSIPINNIILYDADNNPLTTEDQVKLNGNLIFSLSLSISIKISHNALEKLSFIVNSKITKLITLQCAANAIIDFDKVLKTITLKPIVIFIGKVPVVLVPAVKIRGGGKGSVVSGFRTGTSASIFATAGVVYERGRWQTFGSPKIELSAEQPNLYSMLNAKAFLGLEFYVALYGIAGPEFFPYGYLLVFAPNTNGCLELDGGFAADIGVEAGILDRKLAEYRVTVFNHRQKLSELCPSRRVKIYAYALDDVNRLTGYEIERVPKIAGAHIKVDYPGGSKVLTTTATYPGPSIEVEENSTVTVSIVGDPPGWKFSGYWDIYKISWTQGATRSFNVGTSDKHVAAFFTRACCDLLISKLWVEPAQISVGQAGKVWFTIKNVGNSPSPSFKIGFLVDDRLQTVISGDELSPGQERMGFINFQWPDANCHKLSIAVDIENSVPECDENNNVHNISFCPTPQCVNRPSIWTDKAEYCVGDDVNIYITVSVPSYVDVWITYPDGRTKFLLENRYLEDPQKQYRITARAGEPMGTRTMYLKAKACGTEVTVRNNFTVQSCSPSLLPDLKIVNISIEHAFLCIQTLHFYIWFSVTIKNVGNVASNPTLFYAYLPNCKEGSSVTRNVKSLQPGEATDVYIMGEVSGPGWCLSNEDSVVVECIIDPYNNVAELNETNNSIRVKVYIIREYCP